MRGMEKEHIAIYLPVATVAKIDGVASAELRSRANTTRWLVEQALQRREAAERAEPAQAS